jgi:hypothetical protein
LLAGSLVVSGQIRHDSASPLKKSFPNSPRAMGDK